MRSANLVSKFHQLRGFASFFTATVVRLSLDLCSVILEALSVCFCDLFIFFLFYLCVRLQFYKCYIVNLCLSCIVEGAELQSHLRNANCLQYPHSVTWSGLRARRHGAVF